MKSAVDLAKRRSNPFHKVLGGLRNPWVRKAILLLLYATGLSMSLILAYELRFDFNLEEQYRQQLLRYLPWVVALKLIFLFCFRQFEGLLSYFSLPDLNRLFLATFLSFTILTSIWFISWGAFAPPRGVILSDFLISFLGLAGTRLGFRLLRERYLAPSSRHSTMARRVGIIGAGDVGASLVKDLFAKRGLGLLPVGFFDDDRRKWGSRIHG